VLLSHADSRDAERLFERFQSALRERPLPEIGVVSFSGGAAELLGNDDATALIVRTDAALALAKSSGRDMVVTAGKRPNRDVA
jgi:GGDEF domain-containing protein